MEVLLLNKDGRCKWLENKVLTSLLPQALKMAANPFARKMIVIVDWISNDKGKVGVDLKWFKSLGVPAVESYKDLPEGDDFVVVNTGYDSIVDEEQELKQQGVEIIDKPCPFIRRIRTIFEDADSAYQYVYLCESNHITMKNFASVYPKDMILVQMDNYEQRIREQQNGKPLRLVPYVTYLRSHTQQILEFAQAEFPQRDNDYVEASCLWIHSKASPIIEIDNLSEYDLKGINEALLVTTPGSTNKSLVSLLESLQKKGLTVFEIGSFRQFLKYERSHRHDRVLLVRSPIPNTSEAPILAYLDKGYLGAMIAMLKQQAWFRRVTLGSMTRLLYLRNLVFRNRARQEAAKANLSKINVQVTTE